MIRAVFVAALAGFVLCVGPANAALGPDDQAALARGQQSLAWLEAASCPRFGMRMSVKGLETQEAVSRVRSDSWAFAQGRLAAVQTAQAARAHA